MQIQTFTNQFPAAHRVCPKHGTFRNGTDCPVTWRFKPFVSWAIETDQECPGPDLASLEPAEFVRAVLAAGAVQSEHDVANRAPARLT